MESIGIVANILPSGIGGNWAQPSGSSSDVPTGGQLYQQVTWSGRQLVGPATSELAKVVELSSSRPDLALQMAAVQALAQRFGGAYWTQYFELARQLEQLDEQIYDN